MNNFSSPYASGDDAVGLHTERALPLHRLEAVVTRDEVSVGSNALCKEMLLTLTVERARIARDMHDTLAASLSRISLFAGGMQVNSADGPEKVAQTASMIRQTAHDALDELKRIIGVLRGSADDSNGGRQSVEGIPDLVHSAREKKKKREQ